jgi:asparagine synthase (glutamine-hydrolysing)
MYHSLEVRLPFLDKEVIELASRIRWDYCLDLDRGIGKLPLRRILRNNNVSPLLPKRGFGAPIERWLHDRFKCRMDNCLRGLDVLAGIPVDRKALIELWTAHEKGQIRRGLFFWRILVLWEWLRWNISCGGTIHAGYQTSL